MERKRYPPLKELALRGLLAAGIGAGTFSCKQPEIQAAPPPSPVKVELPVVKTEPVVTREPVLPSPTPTFTPEPTPTPEKIVTKEEMLATVNEIIFKIDNPDPALLEKYKVNPIALKRNQDIIICGYDREEIKRGEGKAKKCADDSLLGVKEAIEAGDFQTARARLEAEGGPLSKIRTSQFGDRILLKKDQINEIDPQKKFIPDVLVFPLSDVKKEAFFIAVGLLYQLDSVASSGK